MLLDPEPSFTFFSSIDTNLLLGSIGIIFLLICSAMVSAAEVALFSLSQKDLNALAEENSSKANLIAKLLQRPKKLLATILVANNFSHIGVVIIFSYSANSLFESIASPLVKFIVEVVLVTFLILLLPDTPR